MIIERDSPSPYLPAELALPRNSIVKRDGGKEVGTGPFVVSRWVRSKELVLAAREDYWEGRPFLDSIEIDLGTSFRDQTMALDLGKTQLIEAAPEQARRATIESRRVTKSAPAELMALVFAQPAGSAQEQHLRDALALSIDRESLNKVVLQGGGEPAGGLLPDWMTGYEFLFPSQMDLTRAREERAEIPHAGVWTLGFDPNDSVENVVAERIILNAGEAGLRNGLRGPGTFNIDTGVAKSWHITESQFVKFSWQVYNVTNSARFDVGTMSLNGNNYLSSSSSFGNFSSTLSNPRVMEFGLRYTF